MSLQNEFNLIDFAHDSTLFVGINDNIFISKCSVQQKQFYKLLQESKTENDPEKVIESYPLRKKLLAKGLNFCLQSNQLKYVDYSVHFELLCLMRT